jgi:chaperonin GroES
VKVIPLGDKVVVQRLDAEAKTAGGIVLPDSAQEQQSEGRILSVGEGVRAKAGRLVPFQVREGDRVVFSAWAGTELQIDGEEVLVLSESDILAVLSS